MLLQPHDGRQNRPRVLKPLGACTLKYIDAQWPDDLIELTADGFDVRHRDLSPADDNDTIVVDAMAEFSSTEQFLPENWRCEVDAATAVAAGQFIFEIDGLDQEFYDDPAVHSGDTTIEGGMIIDGRYVVNSKENILVGQTLSDGEEGDDIETRRRQRRLVQTTGDKFVLVVRVVGRDGAAAASEDEIRRETFDTNDINLRTQMDGCSGGKLKMLPYNGFTEGGTESTSRPFISGGVTTLFINGNFRGASMFSAEAAVRNEIARTLGSLEQFDHIMMCLPPGTDGP